MDIIEIVNILLLEKEVKENESKAFPDNQCLKKCIEALEFVCELLKKYYMEDSLSDSVVLNAYNILKTNCNMTDCEKCLFGFAYKEGVGCLLYGRVPCSYPNLELCKGKGMIVLDDGGN